jgi:hypothetical protein
MRGARPYEERWQARSPWLQNVWTARVRHSKRKPRGDLQTAVQGKRPRCQLCWLPWKRTPKPVRLFLLKCAIPRVAVVQRAPASQVTHCSSCLQNFQMIT